MSEKVTISLPGCQWEAILRGLASSGWDGMHAVLSHELSEVRAGVVAEEPEWEYGVGWHWDGRMIAFSTNTRAAAEKYIECHPEDDDFGSHILVRREPERSAGPWVPVKQEGAET